MVNPFDRDQDPKEWAIWEGLDDIGSADAVTDAPATSLVDLIDADWSTFLDRMGRLLADADGKAPSYPEYVYKAYLRHKADAKAKEKLREELTGDDIGKLAASVFDRSKLADLPRPEQLIDGILTREAYTVLAGQSQAMKSFLALAWAASVATGRAWLGRHKAAHGTVVYVAAEGASGIHERLRAWEVANNGGREIEPNRLHLVTQAVQLGNTTHVRWLVDFATGVDADLVVVDTLRRCTAGLNEDSNTEMSPVLTGTAEQLRQACGATTLFVHHTGHAAERSRGASCIENDADAVWKIARVGTSDERKLEQPKSKDAARVEQMSLVFQTVRGTASGHLTTGFGDGLWNYVHGFPGGATVDDLQAYWAMDKRDSARKKAERSCTSGVLVKHESDGAVTYTANPAAGPNQRPQDGRGEDGLRGLSE